MFDWLRRRALVKRPTEDIALQFCQSMQQQGIPLSVTWDSLLVHGDTILHRFDQSYSQSPQQIESQVCGFEAVIGEVLVKQYGAKWRGKFSASKPARNYYLSYLKVGSRRFYPSRFILYRMSNGEVEEGTLKDYLSKRCATWGTPESQL